MLPRIPIPLELRVPQPAPVFVGREAELAALIAAGKRGPVTVVHGPEGIGKTALLLQVLHRGFPRRVGAMRYVRVGQAAPAEAVLRALLAGRSLAGEDWAGVLADPRSVSAAALDVAEEAEAWLVVDADEATETAGVAGWIGLLARHAQKSRWWVTTRVAVAADAWLAGQVVALGAMSEAEQRALAERFDAQADPGAVAWALRVAAGSPGWLRAALNSPGVGSLPARDTRDALQLRILFELSAEDRDALLRMSVAEGALPVLPALSEGGRQRLEAAGWLEAGQVTSVPRAHLAAVTPADVWRRACCQAAAALAQAESLSARLETLRLWLAGHALGEAAAWLDLHGDALVAGGHAPRILALLLAHQVPVLERWLLRSAVEAGGGAARSLTEPTDPSPSTRFEWARVLASRGELAAAEAEAAHLQAHHPALARDALLLRARCVMNGGRIADALAMLEAGGLAPDDLPATCLAVAARLVLGRPGALAEARALASRAAATDDPDALRVRLPVALLFYRQGLLREAERAFQVLVQDEAAPLALRRPEVGVTWFGVLHGRGHLAAAAQQLDRLAPLLEEGSLWGLPVAFGRLAVDLARGDLGLMEAELDRLHARVEQTNHHDFNYFGLALREELARVQARPPVVLPLPPSGTPYYAALHGLHRARRQVRAGEEVPALASTAWHGEGRIIEWLLAADRALVSAALAEARRAADQALILAREQGFSALEAEARALLAEAALLATHWPAAREQGEALVALGQAMGSVRFEGEGRFHVLASAPPDWAELERLAGGTAGLPATRRARAILGAATEPLDHVDAALVAALRLRWSAPLPAGASERAVAERSADRGPASAAERRGNPPDSLSFSAAEAWSPGWGIDLTHQRAWLPDGRWVELQGRPQLWKLLVSLTRGEADKEALVGAIWGETDYHPLRHDNRLQASVRNLRVALADESPPVRICTTEVGYCLGGTVRIVGQESASVSD